MGRALSPQKRKSNIEVIVVSIDKGSPDTLACYPQSSFAKIPKKVLF